MKNKQSSWEGFEVSEDTKRDQENSKQKKETVKEPKLLRCGRRFYYVASTSEERSSHKS